MIGFSFSIVTRYVASSWMIEFYLGLILYAVTIVGLRWEAC